MILGVMADSHDNLIMTSKALDTMAEEGVDMLLHCGDFVAPFTLNLILEAKIPFAGVFGNNDGERQGLSGLSGGICRAPLRMKINGCSVVMAHDPECLYKALDGGDEIGLCGHTHLPAVTRQGSYLIVNPGETGGWLTGRCTVALIRLDTREVDIIELGEQSGAFQA